MRGGVGRERGGGGAQSVCRRCGAAPPARCRMPGVMEGSGANAALVEVTVPTPPYWSNRFARSRAPPCPAVGERRSVSQDPASAVSVRLVAETATLAGVGRLHTSVSRARRTAEPSTSCGGHQRSRSPAPPRSPRRRDRGWEDLRLVWNVASVSRGSRTPRPNAAPRASAPSLRACRDVRESRHRRAPARRHRVRKRKMS